MIYLLYLSVFLFVILSLWSIIALKKTNFLWIYIPLNIVVVLSTIFVYNEIIGGPTTKNLPETFKILAYEQTEESIFLWIYSKESPEPVYYKLPANDETKKKLSSLRGQIKEGKVVAMMRRSKSKLLGEYDVFDVTTRQGFGQKN